MSTRFNNIVWVKHNVNGKEREEAFRGSNVGGTGGGNPSNRVKPYDFDKLFFSDRGGYWAVVEGRARYFFCELGGFACDVVLVIFCTEYRIIIS